MKIGIPVDRMTNWELLARIAAQIKAMDEHTDEMMPDQREVLLNLDGAVTSALSDLRRQSTYHSENDGRPFYIEARS